MKQKIIKFKDWDCVIVKHRYQDNNRIALQLIDAENGEPIAMATVNLPQIEDIEPNTVFIKDYSENDGMLKTLVDNKIVKYKGIKVNTGFVTIPVCEIIHESLRD